VFSITRIPRVQRMLLTGDVASRRLSPILPGDEWLARMNEGGRRVQWRAARKLRHNMPPI
jgi:hypothetical protein